MGSLDGKVACVTGGTRGIGLAIAKAFLDEGAKVVINGRDKAKAQRTLDELNAGSNVHFIAGDVKKREDCEAVVDGTVAHFGRIDILVANAGGAANHAPIADLTDEAMEDALVWNFWHTFWVMRRAFKYMIPQQSGRIINVSSVEGKVGKPGISTYVSSKHAVNGLTKSAAHEVGTLGITVNAVCPGSTLTDFHVDRAKGAGKSIEQLRSERKDTSLIGRWADPEEIAWPIVWLSSNEASFITGTTLMVDGGLHIM